MLPRSYKDEKLAKNAKPFRNPARHPEQVKESKYFKIIIGDNYAKFRNLFDKNRKDGFKIRESRRQKGITTKRRNERKNIIPTGDIY